MARQELSENEELNMSPENLLDVLACPRCKGELILKSGRLDAYGFLLCGACNQRYPVNNGIVNVLPPELQSSLDEQERDAALSIKEANMSYGNVYHKEDATPTKGTIISANCLIPRSMDFILQRLNGHDARILETCCAQGTTASYLYKNGYKPFCFDISLESIMSLREHHPHIENPFIADAENMPLKDNSFNTVIFNGALHHLPDPRHALAESFRVLVSGGQVIIVEPNSVSNEAMRIILKAFTRPASALKDFKLTWKKFIAKISGKKVIEHNGKKYQTDIDGRWIKGDEMDQEISLSYILRIAKSAGFKVREVKTHDIAIVPFRLFKPDPGIATRKKLERIDALLGKIPLVNTYGEISHIVLQKP